MMIILLSFARSNEQYCLHIMITLLRKWQYVSTYCENPQYCHRIVRTLSLCCDNNAHHIVNFHYTAFIHVNHMWPQYCATSSIIWPHTVNIYDNRIKEIRNTFTIYRGFWTIWWTGTSLCFSRSICEHNILNQLKLLLNFCRIDCFKHLVARNSLFKAYS